MGCSWDDHFSGISLMPLYRYPTPLEIREALDVREPVDFVTVVDEDCFFGRKILGIILLVLVAIIELEDKIALLLAIDKLNSGIVHETLPNESGLSRSTPIIRDMINFNHLFIIRLKSTPHI